MCTRSLRKRVMVSKLVWVFKMFAKKAGATGVVFVWLVCFCMGEHITCAECVAAGEW